MTTPDTERLYRLAIEGDIEASAEWIRQDLRRGGTPQPEGERCGPHVGKAKLKGEEIYEGRRKHWVDVAKAHCWALMAQCSEGPNPPRWMHATTQDGRSVDIRVHLVNGGGIPVENCTVQKHPLGREPWQYECCNSNRYDTRTKRMGATRDGVVRVKKDHAFTPQHGNGIPQPRGPRRNRPTLSTAPRR